MRCSKCGKQLNDNISTCPICGQSIINAESVHNKKPYSIKSESHVEKTGAFAVKHGSRTESAEKNTSNNGKHILIASAILLIGCIAVFLFIRNLSRKTLSNTKAEDIFLSNGNTVAAVAECLNISNVTGNKNEKLVEMKSIQNTMFGEIIKYYNVLYTWDKNISEWNIISKKDLEKNEFIWNAESLAGEWEYEDNSWGIEIYITLSIENYNGTPHISNASIEKTLLQSDSEYYIYKEDNVFFGNTNLVEVPLFSDLGREWYIEIDMEHGIYWGERWKGNYLIKND